MPICNYDTLIVKKVCLSNVKIVSCRNIPPKQNVFYFLQSICRRLLGKLEPQNANCSWCQFIEYAIWEASIRDSWYSGGRITARCCITLSSWLTWTTVLSLKDEGEEANVEAKFSIPILFEITTTERDAALAALSNTLRHCGARSWTNASMFLSRPNSTAWGQTCRRLNIVMLDVENKSRTTLNPFLFGSLRKVRAFFKASDKVTGGSELLGTPRSRFEKCGTGPLKNFSIRVPSNPVSK